jgi:hypothetical protein
LLFFSLFLSLHVRLARFAAGRPLGLFGLWAHDPPSDMPCHDIITLLTTPFAFSGGPTGPLRQTDPIPVGRPRYGGGTTTGSMPDPWWRDAKDSTANQRWSATLGPCRVSLPLRLPTKTLPARFPAERHRRSLADRIAVLLSRYPVGHMPWSSRRLSENSGFGGASHCARAARRGCRQAKVCGRG